MIFIIFISLAVVYYFVQHFEKKRNARMEEQYEKRKQSFTKLLKVLKEKENKNN